MKKGFGAALLACFALGLFACDNAWFEDVVKTARDGAAKPEVTVVTHGGNEDEGLPEEEDGGGLYDDEEDDEDLPEEEAGPEENPDLPHVGGGEGEYQGIKVASVALNVTEITISRSQTPTYQLTATVDPPEAPVTWYSTSNSVATVDQNGLVTGHANSIGQKIDIGAKSGGKSAVCKVKVQ
jgi:hypothetical protein